VVKIKHMESILVKLEDLIEEVETEELSVRELLSLLNIIREEVEEKILNDSLGTLEWENLD
jgi:hypothetical protein|tara:strand:- start:145 stop:327 length:183 start_codon:yes stop_codon:yes gene_type:complete